MIVMPVIFILFALIMFFASFGSGGYVYDVQAIEGYADACYHDAFHGKTEDYDGNILIIFLAEDDAYCNYEYYAWVGDNVDRDIQELFGGKGTLLGNTIESNFTRDSYQYSLGNDLSFVIETMEPYTLAELGSTAGTSDYVSSVMNDTDIRVNETKVNEALNSFTQSTGIPIALAVADMEDVLPKDTGVDFMTLIFALVFAGAGVFMIVASVRTRRAYRKNAANNQNGNNDNNGNNGSYNNNYNNNGYN